MRVPWFLETTVDMILDGRASERNTDSMLVCDFTAGRFIELNNNTNNTRNSVWAAEKELEIEKFCAPTAMAA